MALRVAGIRAELSRFEASLLTGITDEEIEIMLSIFERLQPSLDNDKSSNES